MTRPDMISVLNFTAGWRTSCVAVAAWCVLAAHAHAQTALTNGAKHSGTIATVRADRHLDVQRRMPARTSRSRLAKSNRPSTSIRGFDCSRRTHGTVVERIRDAGGADQNVTATQTGTYTVLVSAHSGFPSGTGGYVLRWPECREHLQSRPEIKGERSITARTTRARSLSATSTSGRSLPRRATTSR